jgi:hypothetical protein
MMRFQFGKTGAMLGAALLAGCAAKTPPPPPPPPPPPVEVIPIRPLPPSGATYIMAIPARGPDGRHLTPLRGLDDDQRLWYFRSGWNVAALNCIGPQFEPILTGYGKFLKDNAKTLKAVNERIDRGYRKDYPTRGAAVAAREKLMTSVYNYFALPPARAEFCQSALNIAGAAAAMPKPDGAALAAANFAQFETPFENFFTAYEQYQRDSAAWDARYGARYGASQPGYLAVQAARAVGVPQVGVSDPASTTVQPVAQAGVVIDETTGASIPVVPVPQQGQSTPVVQPVPQTPPKP